MDAIVVLGCSDVLREKEKKSGQITPYFHSYSRLMKAIDIYNYIDGKAIFVCSGNNNQSKNMKEFLIEKGIPVNKIYEERDSRNTVENCIYTYNILKDFTLFNIHLVTNDYHICRANIIFSYFLYMLNQKVTLKTYDSDILSYIEDITEDDVEEVQKLHVKDVKIRQTKMPNSLEHYRKLQQQVNF